MEKFLSNLRGDGDKKDDAKKGGSEKWRGGSSDMDALKKKNSSTASKVGNAVSGVGSKGSAGNNNNVFANAGKNINDAFGKIDLFNNNKQKAASKGGARLGGTLPGIVISISLSEQGPLGLEVEKRKNSDKTTIISRVIPDSQAQRAGLQRGDIVCYPGGEEEYAYNQFVSLAKSGKRPLRFDVRRIESSVFGGGNTDNNGGGKKVSADAAARKQAMIAAAEAREAKFKAKTAPTKPKPVPKSTSADKLQHFAHTNEVESEETKRAINLANAGERADAEALGYNPYEAKAMTAGQARTATVAAAKGDISAENAPSKIGGGAMASPGLTNPPTDPAASPLDPAFEHAFQTLVTSNAEHSAVLKSLKVMRTLITNAITKGQQGDDETSSKFRRVRLSNPKIKDAITDMSGALELMMCVGFILSENEEDSETYLVYPPGDTGPDWLQIGLERMESYEKAK